MNKTKHIGTIDVGGRMLVCDPCYLLESLHPGLVAWIDVEGEAECYIELTDETQGWGLRVSELRAEFKEVGQIINDWEHVATVGVDSGQMAMFDEAMIEQWGGDERPGGTFDFNPTAHAGEFNYQGVCNVTHDAEQGSSGGVVDRKVAASSSGIGDGTYRVFVARGPHGAVSQIAVRFLEWEDENEAEAL